jgi:hypothetical protein
MEAAAPAFLQVLGQAQLLKHQMTLAPPSSRQLAQQQQQQQMWGSQQNRQEQWQQQHLPQRLQQHHRKVQSRALRMQLQRSKVPQWASCC